jgi:ribokinase
MDFDVAVLGSLHLDIMVTGGRLPRPDETVMAEAWRFKCGGKGGNQAVAAADAGARTIMGGCIGRDAFGERLLANLKDAQIDCRAIAVDATQGSGMSVAIDEPDGDYGAVVVSGVNRLICGTELDGIEARVLILQNEIPHTANRVAAKTFRSRGTYVIHNAAPARPPDVDGVNLIVVNRVEAQAMTGMAAASLDDARRAASSLAKERDAIVTMGKLGYAIAMRGGEASTHSPSVTANGSAHGAGDRFVGALAARIAYGDPLVAAAEFAANAVYAALIGKS